MPHHIRGECGVILGSNILPYICNGDALTDTATHVLHGQTHWLMLIGGGPRPMEGHPPAAGIFRRGNVTALSNPRQDRVSSLVHKFSIHL